MKLSQAGKMAISAVLSNKLRSFLTMLGIIIGVMAVTVLVSLVQGATGEISSQLDELGGDQLIVSVTNTQKRMTLSEAMALTEEDCIEYVSPNLSGSGTVKANGKAADVTVNGITSVYPNVQGLEIASGRAISEVDDDYRLNVCIIGSSVADELFENTDPLNQNLRLSGKDYRVVGVLKEKEQTLFGDSNSTVYIPYTNAQRLLSNVNVSNFYVSGKAGTDLSEVRNRLNQRLKEKYGDDESYRIVNMADVMDIVDNVTGALELLLGVIAGISLVVGGIGIMNIMLVSVTERTREIGIRKAIGAQRGDIIIQFMIESVTISMIGGVIGLGLSQAVLSTVNVVRPDYHFAISLSVAGVAMGFAVLVGVVFGIYPANKAASLKPINALRYE